MLDVARSGKRERNKIRKMEKKRKAHWNCNMNLMNGLNPRKKYPLNAFWFVISKLSRWIICKVKFNLNYTIKCNCIDDQSVFLLRIVWV